MKQSLADELSRATGRRIAAEPDTSVGGGSINECYRWASDQGPLFVKLARRERLVMFEAEAAGLTELAAAHALRVPRVLGLGESAGQSFLALEWIEFGTHSAGSERLMGEQLAAQHRVTSSAFGWHRDNTIGSTPQVNDPERDWVRFLVERRLRFQLELAARNSQGSPQLIERGSLLCERAGQFFATYRPVPSLLHGDLWGGNWATDVTGRPVIFDPAVYYGDREADLAMTHLFGGFGREFYRAYEASWPLDRDAPARRALYNLYHVLNHLNLFGGGYQRQAQSLIDQLLAITQG
jgi:fructosamine-3-kinase